MCVGPGVDERLCGNHVYFADIGLTLVCSCNCKLFIRNMYMYEMMVVDGL